MIGGQTGSGMVKLGSVEEPKLGNVRRGGQGDGFLGMKRRVGHEECLA